jgi:hypothetical protein
MRRPLRNVTDHGTQCKDDDHNQQTEAGYGRRQRRLTTNLFLTGKRDHGYKYMAGYPYLL